jgi:hypothetical protein
VTTKVNHPTEEDLVLFFYGEAADQDATTAHVEACDECQALLRGLKAMLDAVDAHPVPDRGPGYGAEVWARVQQRLEQEPARTWLSWFVPRRLALAAGVAVLVVAAFVAGRLSQSPAAPTQARADRPANVEQAAAAPVRERILLVAVGDHLERSQIVLVELMNSPVGSKMDISGSQEWARDLVPANRLFRQTAVETGERGVADVLDALERVLVEIANSPSRLSSAEFERIRSRIEEQGIVFKIRVLDSQVREREQRVASRPARVQS